MVLFKSRARARPDDAADDQPRGGVKLSRLEAGGRQLTGKRSRAASRRPGTFERFDRWPGPELEHFPYNVPPEQVRSWDQREIGQSIPRWQPRRWHRCRLPAPSETWNLQDQSPLFRLPAELLDMIYDACFGAEAGRVPHFIPTREWPEENSSPEGNSPAPPYAALLVCKRLYHALLPRLLHSLHISMFSALYLPWQIPASSLSHIRQLTLTFFGDHNLSSYTPSTNTPNLTRYLSLDDDFYTEALYMRAAPFASPPWPPPSCHRWLGSCDVLAHHLPSLQHFSLSLYHFDFLDAWRLRSSSEKAMLLPLRWLHGPAWQPPPTPDPNAVLHMYAPSGESSGAVSRLKSLKVLLDWHPGHSKLPLPERMGLSAKTNEAFRDMLEAPGCEVSVERREPPNVEDVLRNARDEYLRVDPAIVRGCIRPVWEVGDERASTAVQNDGA